MVAGVRAGTHLPVGNVDVHGILVVQQAPHIRHGRVQQPLLVVQAAPLDGLGRRARVRQAVQLLTGRGGKMWGGDACGTEV